MATLFGMDSVSSVTRVQGMKAVTGLPTGDRLALNHSDSRHFSGSVAGRPAGSAGGPAATAPGAAAADAASFETAMLKALEGVNAQQVQSSEALELMMTNPDAIDAHDVTIGMAKASMSLNITRTVLDRVVRAWRDLINTR